MRNYIVKITYWSLIVILTTMLALMVSRQLPRSFPQDAAALQSEFVEIFNAKCADCHDSSQPAPFYAHIPLLGAPVMYDYTQGVRHWDPFDRSYLGEKPGDAAKNSPFPLSIAEKAQKVLKDGSMPPRIYKTIHWGTHLSRSEKDIVAAWIAYIRSDWLKRWSITESANKTFIPIPVSIPHDSKKAALGKKLFNDKRLSSDNTVSCSSCHGLDKGGTDNLRYSKGVGGQLGGVNAPTVFNAVFNLRQFWDGRAADLVEQAGGPPLNPVEMACTNWNQIIVKLDADTAFKKEFLESYPEGFTEKSICGAIAEYEKTLLTPNCRFDRYLKGEADILTREEKKGFDLFVKHSCVSCHNGPSLGGQSFEHADLKADYFANRETDDNDKGLLAFSKQPKDERRFKVPSLRNIELTAPYMHDGTQLTLDAAIKAMLENQVGVIPSNNDLVLLEAFLKTLSMPKEDKESADKK